MIRKATFSRCRTQSLLAGFVIAVQALSCEANAASQTRFQIALAKTNVSTTSVALPSLPTRNPALSRKSVRGPIQIVVSVPDQKIDVFAGTLRVATSRISTGKRGYATPEGVFSIIQKNRRHYSNIYRGAPMPFMQRLTWSGIALHGGHVPGRPASHGCIRLPHGFAKKLFGITGKNAHVIVNRGRRSPVVFEHANLFRPRTPSVKSLAGKINAFTLDGLPQAGLTRWDRRVQEGGKVDLFVKALRHAHHPNEGSHRRATVRLVQTLLGYLGYDIERPDGDLGPKTRRVISAFQRNHGLESTGLTSDRLTDWLYWALGRRMVRMDEAEADIILTPASINEPLRILITRSLEYNEIKQAQRMLDQLGYYVGSIDGAIGRYTRSAIEKFRAKVDLPGPTQVDRSLLDALVAASGRSDEGATGHLYVRQGFRDIYDAPVTIKNLDQPLGTHVFTAMDFGEGRNSKVTWTALAVAEKTRLQVQATTSKSRFRVLATDAGSVLNRIVIPPHVRTYIEELMMPGTSLIVSDHGISRESGEGTDFVVLTR